MTLQQIAAVLLLCVSGGLVLKAQGSTSSVSLLATDTQMKAVKQSTTTTFSVDRSDSNDSQLLDIITHDGSLRVTVTDPNGFAVNSVNASSAGYDWQVITVNQPGTELLMLGVGSHNFVTIPSGSPAGQYQITIDATAAAADSIVSVWSDSDSSISFGVTTAQKEYNAGDNVIVSAVLLNGSLPASGTVVTADIIGDLPTTEVAVSSFQQISTSGSSNQGYQKIFQVKAVNSGAAKRHVTAEIDLRQLSGTVSVDRSHLTFPDLAASSSGTSTDTITISCAQEADCDPTSLSLIFHSLSSSSTRITLKDDGIFPDGKANDGLYTATIPAGGPGEYSILAHGSATGNSGVSVSRASAATFSVNTGAVINDVNYALVMSSDGTNQVTGVNIIGNLSVQQAATYRFCAEVSAGGDDSVQSCVRASLTAGTNPMSTAISAPELIALGGSGTYPIRKVRLMLEGPTSEKVVAMSLNPKTISGIIPSQLSKGNFYFTGVNSAQGILAKDGTYSALQVSMGIFGPGGACSSTGILTTAAGTGISGFSGSGYLNAGSNQVMMRFDGADLAVANINGQLTLTHVELLCRNSRLAGDNLFQTPSFSSSQFSSKPTFSVDKTSVSVGQGSSVTVSLQCATDQQALLAVLGSPSGVNAVLSHSEILTDGSSVLSISASPTATPGTYPLTLLMTTSTKCIQRTVSLVLTSSQAQ